MILPPATLPLCQFRQSLSSKIRSEITLGERKLKGIHEIFRTLDVHFDRSPFAWDSELYLDSLAAIEYGTRGGRWVSAARPIRARFILLPGDRSAGRTVRVPSPRSVRGRGPHRRAPGERMRSGRDVIPTFRTDAEQWSGAGRAESAAASEAGVGFDVVYRVILDVLQRHEHVAESLSRYSRILTCTQPIQVAVTHLLTQLLDRT